jgi:hypothetical protein
LKATIRDTQMLNVIKPLEVVAYLRSTGWHQERAVEDRWATWIKGDEFEIALPLTRDLGDYVLRMADTLQTLEAVEGRSQLEILNDLLTSSSDVLRLGMKGAEATDGTIPIEEGTQLVSKHGI